METDIPQTVRDTIQQKNATAYFYQKDYAEIATEHLAIPASNIATALKVIDLLQAQLPVSAEAINMGLKQIKITGRCQIINEKPLIVIDVAHNAQSAKRFAEFITSKAQDKKVYAVFSALKDKNIAQLVAPFVDIVDEWHIAKLNTPRAAKVEQIQQHIEKKSVVYQSIADAYYNLLSKVTENDMLIVYGSFFTVGEILSICRSVQ